MKNSNKNLSIFSPEFALWRFVPNGKAGPLVVVGDHCFDDGLIHWTIPDGTHTDLTSYPYFLKYFLLIFWIVGFYFGFSQTWIALAAILLLLLIEPYGREQRASIFHDDGYARGKALGYPRVEIDGMYLTIMTHDGVSVLRRTINYLGVRLFGWLIY